MADGDQVAIQTVLPLFDGKKPEYEVLGFTGNVSAAWGADPHLKDGQVGYMVISYIVKSVNHDDDKDGILHRLPKLKVLDSVRVDGRAGHTLIQDWKGEEVRRVHERDAQGSLELMPDDLPLPEGWTRRPDGSIVDADGEIKRGPDEGTTE